MYMNIIKRLTIPLFLIFIALVLVLTLKGITGNPSELELSSGKWMENGPFELSPDRGRFALTYSLVENRSFYFTLPLASFTTPDLGYTNGHYVSLFAPGVSFLIIPGYIIGRLFNLAQAGTFAVIALFALFNSFLIYAIAKKLTASSTASILSAFTYIFASPAFSYGVSLYQHHITTFIMLLSVYVLLRFKSIWSLFLIWFLCGISLVIDYPNLLLMLPVALYAFTKIIVVKNTKSKLSLKIHYLGFITIITAFLPLLFLFWFNNASYSNPFQLSGTVASVGNIDKYGKPVLPKAVTGLALNKGKDPLEQKQSAVNFFQTRNMLNGFYIFFISSERSILWFTPVLFLSIVGIILMYKKKIAILSLLLGIIGMNIVLYSMWGDPWGGWAFGARYLIPSYAIFAIFIAYAFSFIKYKKIFTILFLILFSYSVTVNLVGALTSNKIPPKGEALALTLVSGRQEKYSFDRDFEMLESGNSKSLVWQSLFQNYLTAKQYYLLLLTLILVPSFIVVIINIIKDN
jgi:hypothetical protein